MKDVNISLISKLGWKLLSAPNCLWVSLFKTKYFKYGNLLTSPLPTSSFIWNGIKSIVPFQRTGSCFIPHLSSSLSVWFSPWVPTLPDFRPVPRIDSLLANFPLTVSDLLSSATGNWDLPLLRFLFNPSSVSEILKIKIRSSSEALLWTPCSSGVFSTKSAHHFLSSQKTTLISPLSKSSWKLLWKLKLNHQLRLFLWKMIWNIVPTKERISLAIRYSFFDASCSLCSSSTDSLVYLFFSSYSSGGLEEFFLASGYSSFVYILNG
jgi:hypothetical protein